MSDRLRMWLHLASDARDANACVALCPWPARASDSESRTVVAGLPVIPRLHPGHSMHVVLERLERALAESGPCDDVHGTFHVRVEGRKQSGLTLERDELERIARLGLGVRGDLRIAGRFGRLEGTPLHEDAPSDRDYGLPLDQLPAETTPLPAPPRTRARTWMKVAVSLGSRLLDVEALAGILPYEHREVQVWGEPIPGHPEHCFPGNSLTVDVPIAAGLSVADCIRTLVAWFERWEGEQEGPIDLELGFWLFMEGGTYELELDAPLVRRLARSRASVIVNFDPPARRECDRGTWIR